MSESSKSDANGGEDDEDFISTALKLRNDIKRRVHNGIEKRRKDKINQWIHKLAELLPYKEPKRESKTHLLENIYQYINELKDRNESLLFGNQNTVNEVQVEEIRRLNKRCKELEEKAVNYYRLLERAGISPNGFPQDIHFERPTKYSKKISEQQLNDFLSKSSDIMSDQMNGNNKRLNEFDDNSGQNGNKRSKSSKSRSKRRKDRRDSDRKSSPPTPVLPNSLNPNNNNTVTTGQTSNTGQFVILNDQNGSAVNSDDTPRLIVNTSSNGFNTLNTIQIRPTVGSQQLQILSTNPSLDSMNGNTNLLSGQIVLNLNTPCPQPQPQATAVLLPNGQILPIITQPQQTQQPLLLAPNQSFLFTTSAPQSQQTIITGQSAGIGNTFNSNLNSIKLTQNTSQPQIEAQKLKPVANEKPKEMTTTIESIPESPKQTKKKVNKKIKKQISGSKTSNNSKTMKGNDLTAKDIKSADKKSNEAKTLDSKSGKTGDKSAVHSVNNKIVNKSQKCCKSEQKSDKTIVKSKPELSATAPESNSKTKSKCDILAKATQSIFSPPPSAVAQVANSKKKEALVSSRTERKQVLTDNTISDNKCAKKEDSKSVSIGFSNVCSDKKVNDKYCATSASISANKALEAINDTKNDNYVENRSENNSKFDKSVAEGEGNGNKGGITKKYVNNNPKHSTESTVSQIVFDSQSVSTPEQTTHTTSHTNSQSNTSAKHPIITTEQVFKDQSITNSSRTTPSNSNRLSFDFNSQQNQTNSNCIENTNHSIVENELPTLLLSSLNDENEVSAESVHSVSNSSLPAFLSLSPEHLNEYLPKDNVNNNSETEHSTTQSGLNTNGSVQFGSNETPVEQHPTITSHDNSPRIAQKQQQNYTPYRKPSSESAVVSTPQIESRSSYSTNFPTVSSLIANDYSDFNINSNKTMFSSNNLNNYLENPLMTPKMNSQNNNFIQFGLQNDNSLMPFHPIHNYLSNNNTNSNTNRNFFHPNETQPTVPKTPQNPNQNQTQRPTQAPAATQQPKMTPTQQQNSQSQSQNQSNPVMPMRSQRNPSTEQLLPQHSAIRTEQRLPSQPHQTLARDAVPSSTSTSITHNKSPSNVSSAQYSTHNSFSSYSAEALIRQNEPTVQSIQSTDQNNRYNTNANNSVVPRLQQQNHSFNTDSNAIRSSSRASISYSAESLIQSNPMNNSNPMPNKTTQREVESESLAVSSDTNNRISYYQNINQNNSHLNNTSNQRTEQNNSNNLFNFDHSLNSRLMSTSANTIPQNCGNTYPQITFNSHLPDIRTSTTTTSSESLFAITSNTTTVNRNTTNVNNNSNNVSNSGNNNQISHTVPIIAPTHQQHSPVIYPSNNSQNSQQTKRSTNNSFNPSVNSFIHSNAESYSNPSHSTMYSTTGASVESNINSNSNQYQRSPRNNDIRFTNCLQPTHQNPNPSMSQTNNANTGCFFSNTAPNTTFFPPTTATPFPPLLPNAASPFDATAPFTGAHRPPMFANTFMPDFNTSFVNPSANNTLPPIGSNFNINPSVNHSSNTSSAKTRDTIPSNTRSSSNMTRSPNQSKHSKLNSNNNKTNSSKKQNNSKHNNSSDAQNNPSSNPSVRHSNDNYFSMNDLMSLTTTTPQTNNRYSNFSANNQTHPSGRQPAPSPASVSSNTNNTKIATSSADTSASYTLFRPQSQNSNNGSNVSNVGNFSVNSLHNTNRTTLSSTPSNFGSSAAHHSSHATNFHLSNIFPDINSNNTESLSLSPMKFPPPVTPVVPPPVAPSLGQSSMDVSAGSYQTHHSSSHHQNLYHSHHTSARISTPHNAFNTFFSSGTSATHNPNTHSFDPHITPNNRTTTQMSGISANTTHTGSTFTPPSHPHSHHTYANIVPSFNF